MGTLFVYSVVSSCVLAVLYPVWCWASRGDSSARTRRVTLVAVLLLSLLIPLCFFVRPMYEPSAMAALEHAGMAVVLPDAAVPAYVPEPVWTDWLALACVAGMMLSLLVLGWRVWRLYRCLPTGCLWNRHEADGTRIWCKAGNVRSYCWMRHVVVGEDVFTEDAREILMHEKVHARLHHSWDTLLAEGIRCLQWYNPLMNAVMNSLRDVHEYEADAAVLAATGVDSRHYQMLLVKKAADPCSYALVSSSNHSSLKKRMTMMFKKQSNPWMRLKYLCVLPVAGLAVSASAFPEVRNLAGELSQAEVSHLFSNGEEKTVGKLPESAKILLPVRAAEPRTDDDEVYTKVQVNPEFPGGADALFKFVAEHMKYPEEAQSKAIQGRVIVSFVVEKDGSITHPEIQRSPDDVLSKEALRVVGMFPAWKPGMQDGKPVRTKFTLPVMFRLSGDEAQKKAVEEDKAVKFADLTAPAIRVDGQFVSYENFNRLDTADIAAIAVVRGKAAVALYGERYVDGVMEITTKKAAAKQP